MASEREAAVSGQAWAEFCDTLKSAGELIVAHSETDLDRIEGFRYLSRLTRGGLDSFIEGGDKAYPHIGTLPNMVKIGCDNPDSHYQRVSVSGRHTYRITGSRGTVNYLGIGAYSGGYGQGDSKAGSQGYLQDNDPDAEGAVDIVASVDEPASLPAGARWLEMAPYTSILIIRQFYLDRDSEVPAQLRIECLDPPTPTPEPMSADDLVDGLAMSGLFVHGVVERFWGWVEDLFLPRPNTLEELPRDDHAGGWGDPNQIFRHGYWTLADDEALLIEFTPPECYYWNFQLNNLWEESLDYRFLSVTVNKHSAIYEPDGSVRIVVAQSNPGVSNWMDSSGRNHGTMGLRWNQAVADVDPACTVLKFEEIR